MEITQLTRLGKELNTLIDMGETFEITELNVILPQKQLFAVLRELFEDELDLSAFTQSDIQTIEVLFLLISKTLQPEDNKVESNALNLLVTYCFIGIESLIDPLKLV